MNNSLKINNHYETPYLNNSNLATHLYKKERMIFLYGNVTSVLVNSIIKQVLLLDRINHEEITLFINTGGGSVDSGMALYDILHIVKSPIHTIVTGAAYSMGAILLLAGKKRSILKNSRIMFHLPIISFEKAHINQVSFENTHNELKKTKKLLLDIVLSKTDNFNNNKELFLDILEKRDFFLGAKEAKEYKIIDKILEY